MNLEEYGKLYDYICKDASADIFAPAASPTPESKVAQDLKAQLDKIEGEKRQQKKDFNREIKCLKGKLEKAVAEAEKLRKELDERKAIEVEAGMESFHQRQSDIARLAGVDLDDERGDSQVTP